MTVSTYLSFPHCTSHSGPPKNEPRLAIGPRLPPVRPVATLHGPGEISSRRATLIMTILEGQDALAVDKNAALILTVQLLKIYHDFLALRATKNVSAVNLFGFSFGAALSLRSCLQFFSFLSYGVS